MKGSLSTNTERRITDKTQNAKFECAFDEKKSTPYKPVHKHQGEIKLKSGEIVPVEIEIWP